MLEVPLVSTDCLCRISGYVSDPVLSSKLVELLLSFLLKGAEAYKVTLLIHAHSLLLVSSL